MSAVISPTVVRVATAAGAYDVLVGAGLLSEIGNLLAATDRGKIALICDDNVDQLYAGPVTASLKAAGLTVCKFVFHPGEAQKTLTTVAEILDFMSREQLTRTDRVLALGGGITGDVAGFAASIYLRGIHYVQIPTSLLAMVDSSVGGKTGVNLPLGKNLAGSFWQPSLVLCDPETLRTLPQDCLGDGLAEMIKYGMIADPTLFELLDSPDSAAHWETLIARNINIKSRFVATDTFDRGERQLLNFGHTFGHAVEKCSAYSISHGQAVAIGMVMAARAAERLGISSEPVLPRLCALLEKVGLPQATDLPVESLIGAAMSDKKRSGDTIRFVMPEAIGRCVLYPVPVSRIAEIFQLGVA